MKRSGSLKRTPFPVPLAEDGTPRWPNWTRSKELGRSAGLQGARLALVDRDGAPVVPLRQEQQRRGSPLPAVSGKRKAENRERRAMAESRFPDMNPRCAVPWCTRPADALHEILSRARGGSITDPGNTVPACNICNEELTREPEWGYRLGLIKHSGRCCQGRKVCARYADSDEPVLIPGEDGMQITVWLGDDGQISYEAPDGAA